MNDLENVGNKLKRMFARINKNTENDISVFLALANDKTHSKTLLFDAFDREKMTYYDYVNELISILNTSCAQTDKNGELTFSAKALLDAIVIFSIMWYIDKPENKENFNKCLQFYLDKQSKNNEA